MTKKATASSKTLVATIDTFTKAGRYVPRGGVLSADEIDYKKGHSRNVTEVSGLGAQPVVEVSAIAPTGPNPQNPQQLSPTGAQSTEGYVDNGARLVGETTLPEKVRRVHVVEDDATQSQISEALVDADAERAAAEAEDRQKAAAKAEKEAAAS
jgi:hypothetical protein